MSEDYSFLNQLMREHESTLKNLSPDEIANPLDERALAEYKERAGSIGQKFIALMMRGHTSSRRFSNRVEHYYDAIDTGIGIAHDGLVKVAALPLQVHQAATDRVTYELRIYETDPNALHLDHTNEDAARLIGGCAFDPRADEGVISLRELHNARFLDRLLDQTLANVSDAKIA